MGISWTIAEEASTLRPHPIPAESAHTLYGGAAAPRTSMCNFLCTRKVTICNCFWSHNIPFGGRHLADSMVFAWDGETPLGINPDRHLIMRRKV